jgi:hypothetical protein
MKSNTPTGAFRREPILGSLTSTSVAPPTRITATPPANFVSRSYSFSRVV